MTVFLHCDTHLSEMDHCKINVVQGFIDRLLTECKFADDCKKEGGV